MNIVDQLTRRAGNESGNGLKGEAKMRHDVLYSQLRARYPHLAPENIDLSEVDFDKPDDELRREVGHARGIDAQSRIDEIDLDELTSVSGVQRRRARRHFERAAERKRKKGQAKFHRQQRIARFKQGRPSNHEVAVTRRAREAALAAARDRVAADPHLDRSAVLADELKKAGF